MIDNIVTALGVEGLIAGAVGLAIGMVIGVSLWHLMWRRRAQLVTVEMDRLRASAARETTRAEDYSAKVDYLMATQQRLESELELREIERRRLLADRAVGARPAEDAARQRDPIDFSGNESESIIDLRAGSELERVEGIGPQIAKVLRAAGIASLDELGRANADYLVRVLDEAGPQFRRHDPRSWPDEALSLI